LQQNTAARIGANLHDLIGNPSTPLIMGKQAAFAEQVVAVKEAFTAKQAALSAGREFCRLAINLLRPFLGNEWNTAWKAAGFDKPSLALPRQPAALLTALRAYFSANPAHENAIAGISAEAAEAKANALDAAILAVATAKAERLARKKARDVALEGLRQRLVGLRAELDQILSDADGRWYEFGFNRPNDGAQPAPVENVEVTAVAEGTLLVNWSASTRARNYRVTWSAEANSENAVDVGLFADTQCVLSALPSHVPITVSVSARNASGETKATQVTD